MKCTFCGNKGKLHEVEAPAISVCMACREKLGTHIAVICTGCQTIHWLRKTPQNVATAARLSGLPIQHIQDNPMLHEIKTCRQCYAAVSDFTVTAAWVQ